MEVALTGSLKSPLPWTGGTAHLYTLVFTTLDATERELDAQRHRSGVHAAPESKMIPSAESGWLSKPDFSLCMERPRE